MKNSKEMYDRLAVGDRIRKKRQLLGLTQDELSEKIDRAPKYCADIERGSCGMSIETMLAFAEALNMPLDYMIFGKGDPELWISQHDETLAILELLNGYPEDSRKYALQLLKLFIAATNPDYSKQQYL